MQQVRERHASPAHAVLTAPAFTSEITSLWVSSNTASFSCRSAARSLMSKKRR